MTRVILLLALLSTAPAAAQDAPSGGTGLWDRFRSPPDDARPLVRWWWFGPAVDTAELDREIAAMKAGGFGGFEVQPTYPLALDDPAAGIRTLPFLSDPFLSALRHVGDTARMTGMRMDVTIGSGWPFGGPHVPVSQAAAKVDMVRVSVPAGADRVPVPPMQQGERMLAAFIDGRRLSMVATDTVSVKASPVERQMMVFVAGRTGQ